MTTTTPPTVSIASPAGGTLVAGTMMVTANASDNAGVAGVQKVDVSLAEGRATVTYDPAKAKVPDMKRAVERAGYKAP